MTIKYGLQLSQGQHLSLAPQLQQAIRLLQYSGLELTQEIQRILETNPLLEYDESTAEQEEESQVTVDALREQQIMGNTTASRVSTEDMPGYEQAAANTQTLQDYLLWQTNVANFNQQELLIAHAIIDAINDDGYLQSSVEEIIVCLAQQAINTTEKQIESVLTEIQRFDPTGVGARTIEECLLLQIDSIQPPHPCQSIAHDLIAKYSQVLSRLDPMQLGKKLKVTPEEIQSSLKLIQSLNPRPGTIIGQADVDYIIPDVVCEQRHNVWHVRLNDSVSPAIGLNQQYVSLLRSSTNARDTQFMRDNLKEARWFLKSLENRNQTLLRVAQCIIERQQEFLEKGAEAMQPMILQDVASQLDVHESTVSRVTTQKYLYTPRGVFELKFFFSSHVKNAEGKHCSSTAIRALIKRYIGLELTDKPLSDNKIMQLLEKEHQIKVARRTVTKYREAMAIPASNERRYAPIKG